MGILSKLFWLALFVASTFVFVVLFEHGTTDFLTNAEKEFQNWKSLVTTKVERKADDSDSAAR